MKKINVAEIILDYDLYPRSKVDSQHVGYMIEAMKAGVKLPPVVIDLETKKATDGFHRITGYRRHYGNDHMVNVIVKKYASEQEMFLDAIKYNADHGRMLTTEDRVRCAIKAGELHIPDDELATVLQITMDKLGTLKVDRVAKEVIPVPSTRGKKKVVTYGKRLVPLKHGLPHLAGKTLTEKQKVAHDKFQGTNQSFCVNQVINLIEGDLLDRNNGGLIERLKYLGDLISNL